MTTPDSAEAVNVRIAELCGWKRHSESEQGFGKGQRITTGWLRPDGIFLRRIPDYSGSLDAMHEAEKTLTELEWPRYVTDLNALIGFTHDNEVWTCHATAAQRAAAFLTTKTRTNL